MKFLLAINIILINISCNAGKECDIFPQKYQEIYRRCKGDSSLLIDEIDKYIKLNNNCIIAYLKKGDILFSLGKNEQAALQYREVTEIDPSNVSAFYKYAILQHYMQRYDSAIIFYKKALNLKTIDGAIVDYPPNRITQNKKYLYDIDHKLIVMGLGESYYFNRNLYEASKQFEYNLKKNFKIGECYFYLGIIHLDLGEIQKACNFLQKSKTYFYDEADSYIKQYCK